MMMPKWFLFIVLYACVGICAAKTDCEPVTGTLRLTQVNQDEWQADYRLDRPVYGIALGPHIWQGLPWRQTGVQYDSPWIHEGGAQALSIAGLQATALWSPDEISSYQAKLEKGCQLDPYELQANASSLKGKAAYECGYRLFRDLALPAPLVWRRLLDAAMRTRQPYSEKMLHGLMPAAISVSDPPTGNLVQ